MSPFKLALTNIKFLKADFIAKVIDKVIGGKSNANYSNFKSNSLLTTFTRKVINYNS